MAALLLAAGSASANESCAPVTLGPPHASLDEAAIGALRPLLAAGHRYESGGFIVRDGGKFRASKPVTQRSRTRVNYCIVLPRGGELAGLYHTHVRAGEYSAKDRANAARAGVPSFLGTLSNGTLQVYDPSSATARLLGKPVSNDAPALAAREPAWHTKLHARALGLWTSLKTYAASLGSE